MEAVEAVCPRGSSCNGTVRDWAAAVSDDVGAITAPKHQARPNFDHFEYHLKLIPRLRSAFERRTLPPLSTSFAASASLASVSFGSMGSISDSLASASCSASACSPLAPLRWIFFYVLGDLVTWHCADLV